MCISNSPCAQPCVIFTTIFISCVLAATILVFKTGVYQPAHRCINFFFFVLCDREDEDLYETSTKPDSQSGYKRGIKMQRDCGSFFGVEIYLEKRRH